MARTEGCQPARGSQSQKARRSPDCSLQLEKLHNLCRHSVAQNLRAVQNRAFLIVPFSASTLGVRVGSVAYNLAEAMVALTRGRPLPSLEFSNVSITADGDDVENTGNGGYQAVSRSGVKVFTRLPMFEGIDLHTSCPGVPKDLEIRDVDLTSTNIDKDSTEDKKLESWAVGLVVAMVVVEAVTVEVGYVCIMSFLLLLLFVLLLTVLCDIIDV